MILIISSRNDVHAILVQKKLESQGNEARIFDLMEFSDGSLLDYQIGENPIREFIVEKEPKINLTDVTSVWYRRPSILRSPN